MSDLREVLQENSYLRQKQLIFADCDRYQRARVSTLLSIAAAVAGADYDARGLTYEKLYEMREVFLLSRIALRIHRCPRALQVVDPVSLPGTFIGLAMILAFNDGPLEMTGTLAIIILGMALRQLPVGYRQAVAGLKQIEGSLEQASTNLGAGSFTTFRKIVLPMLKNSLSVSFVYAFMRSMNTLSTVIFLVSPEWNLASINIMSLANQGFLPTASATAVGIMLVIYLTFGVVKLILRDKINIFDL